MSSNIGKREEGFVSLFTVIFFMLLISVITIGFLRIMSIEQRQALDNDLTASALASAESGIEDAKRAILKYSSLPPSDPLKADLRTALTSTACDALFSNANIRSALNIRNDGSITGQANLNQFYTCLSVNLNSPDYVSSSTAGKSEFIPLRSQNGNSFDQIKVSWHLVSTTVGKDGDGIPQRYAPGLTLPRVTDSNPVNSWTDRGYPAYMRVEVYGFPNGNFNRNSVNDRTRSVFLVPNTSSNGAAAGENDPILLSTVDPLPHNFDVAKTGVRGVRCKGNPPAVAVGTYACTATIELPNDPGLRGNNNNYYLRLTPLYGATHFRAELKDSATNSIVNFSEVQPIIDVTGRASDVFRRIQARVRLDSITDLPEYTVESADTICKNMQVADGSFYQPNNCP